MIKKLTYFIFFIIAFSVSAQEKNTYFVETNGLYGFVIPHHRSIEYLLQQHVPSFEISIGKKSFENSLWDSLYSNPMIGMGYQYVNFGSPQILGHAQSILMYQRFSIWKPTHFFNLNARIGLGLAYIDKIWDIHTNYQNLAISSHINVNIGFGIDGKINISENLSLSSGVRFTHFSNGKFKSPNYGINLALGFVGVNYNFSTQKNSSTRDNTKPNLLKWKKELILSAGTTTIAAQDPGSFLISSFVFNMVKSINYKYAVGFGTDLFYNSSMQKTKHDFETIIDNSRMYSGGIRGIFDLNYNRMTMTIQMGSYLYSKPFGMFYPYHRIGLRYRVSNHLLANVTLKSHWALAEYVEWGIGYTW